MKKNRIVLCLSLLVGTAFFAQTVAADPGDLSPDRQWTVGSHAGIQVKTVVGNVFTMGIHASHKVHPKYSIGVLGNVSSGVDLTEYGMALTGWNHMSWNQFNIVPFIGIGAMYADWAGATNTAYYVPAGVTLEYPWNGTVFTGTAQMNLHGIKWDDPEGRDRGSLSFMLGLRM